MKSRFAGKNSVLALFFASLFIFVSCRIVKANNIDPDDYYYDAIDQSLNYDYQLKTNIPPQEFTSHFYDKLENEYKWEQTCSSTVDNTYSSLWQFTDKYSQKWRCRVSISSEPANEANINIMSVSMKICPFAV